MKTNKNFFLLLLLFCFFLLSSCYRASNKIDPRIDYTLSESFIKEMKNPFPPLTLHERNEDWGKEYLIGLAFAKKLDLYQALSNFKRAEILIPLDHETRKKEIEYFIVLCYFLGKKYPQVIEAFEDSSLPTIDKSFAGFHDLLIILYESYTATNQDDKAERIKTVLDQSFPASAEQMELSQAILNADMPKLKEFAKDPTYNYLNTFLDSYESKKKSVSTAEALNAVIPGAGYFYLGQKRSALTAFLLNGLFIYATYEFFHKGNIAAGIITLSFETGWYFGGIYGAGEEAKYYNERIYNQEAQNLMETKKIYPFFMLRYSF